MSVELPPMQLGYPRTPLRRQLVDAVLRGAKTATAGLHADHGPEDPVPAAGDRFVLLGYDDEPVAVLETTEVRVLRPRTSTSRSHGTRVKASRASPTGAARTRSSGQTARSATTR